MTESSGARSEENATQERIELTSLASGRLSNRIADHSAAVATLGSNGRAGNRESEPVTPPTTSASTDSGYASGLSNHATLASGSRSAVHRRPGFSQQTAPRQTLPQNIEESKPPPTHGRASEYFPGERAFYTPNGEFYGMSDSGRLKLRRTTFNGKPIALLVLLVLCVCMYVVPMICSMVYMKRHKSEWPSERDNPLGEGAFMALSSFTESGLSLRDDGVMPF